MKIGILIIGSLWWKNGPRETWRTSHLRTANRVPVRTPIHYGRKSVTKTYTMTFSPSAGNGVALVVPCIAEGESAALFAEAEALWGAEANKAKEAFRISAKWGCVGALFKTDAHSAASAEWSEYFRKCGGKALPAVDTNGLLALQWPQRIDGLPLDFDVLLATTNVETTAVTPEDIAAAWITQGHEDYFFENVRAGIRTADDEKIWRRMVGELDWLNHIDARFAPTIKALRNEFSRAPHPS